MRTTELITQPEPTVRSILEETADLVETVPLYGPPAILLVGPLVLLALIVAGPFLALLTIVAVLVLAAVLVALAAAVLASPYLLVRHIRGHRATARKPFGAPRLVPVDSRRAAA
jgi:hypothetical protein